MTTPSCMSRPRRLLAAAAVVLGMAGLVMLGYGLSQQQVAPQPAVTTTAGQDPAANLAPAVPVAAPGAALTTASVLSPVIVGLGPAAPISIRIPAIEVSSVVNVVGLNPNHTMQVPRQGRGYNQPAWYRYSPTPGEIGPSVIVGHIDSARNGPSVFFKLGALQPGQDVEVTRADHTTVTFNVDLVRSYSKQSFPTLAVYGTTTRPTLRLITCGGRFDSHTGEYLNNTVVFAHLSAINPHLSAINSSAPN